MKNLFFIIALTCAFGIGNATANFNGFEVVLDCEHCAKNHNCDEKCKAGEKSECCAQAKAKNDQNADKATPACCKKGQKTCKGENKTNKEIKTDSDKS